MWGATEGWMLVDGIGFDFEVDGKEFLAWEGDWKAKEELRLGNPIIEG